jgi:hypothetical protein
VAGDGGAKISYLLSRLQQIVHKSNTKILIFSQFGETIRVIARLLENYGISYVCQLQKNFRMINLLFRFDMTGQIKKGDLLVIFLY